MYVRRRELGGEASRSLRRDPRLCSLLDLGPLLALPIGEEGGGVGDTRTDDAIVCGGDMQWMGDGAKA
jgi:hypothetical protein